MKTLLFIPLALLLMGAAPPEDAPVDVERGLTKCRICHGKALQGKKATPPLAGMHKLRLLRGLIKEVPKKMQPIVRGLSEAEKRGLAEHISKLPVPVAPAAPPHKPKAP